MHENVCTYLSGNAWSNVPCEKIGMYEKIFCCYKFLQPLVLEIFLWAMEKVCPEVLYEKKWSRASLSTTFFHTRLLEKLFPLPTKRFRALKVVKIYSNRIFFRTFLFFHMEYSIKHYHINMYTHFHTLSLWPKIYHLRYWNINFFLDICIERKVKRLDP